MAYLDPHLAVTTLEQALRQLITAVLSARDGEGWLERNFTADQLKEWRRKQNDEELTRGRRGHAEAASDLLHYSELRELRDMIIKQWSRGFSLAFAGAKDHEIKAFLLRFEGLRVPQAHSRELLPFEKDLASGIAGDIRNRVTIYLSAKDSEGDPFARIESVTDGHGKSAQDPSSNLITTTGLTLRPGQPVTFTCRATDPKGQELLWTLEIPGRHSEWDADHASGTEVTLRWIVTEQDVRQACYARIRMRAKGAKHHRYGPDQDDGIVTFQYRVLPADA
ncbi:hypothetical protein [Kineococcus glutinatus]|uniref:Ig-like domain-containing protein n=1 Tax=Kineococcus glutinatus TaxID=1070872 RepID=A0ABP9H2J3_9ACTN